MYGLTVDFSTENGNMKQMHGVNNGPVYKFTSDQRVTNIDAFRDAGIPFARTHDASFYANYGGEHTVDIHAIFPDFSKPADDPTSYDFVLTDEYLKVIQFAGVETFYRLGSKIEHWPKKYGTVVPPDFQKWAEICEHIIRHYTEGWADGFRYHIRYWEIWNEPDMISDDMKEVDKKCWGGTRQQFFELYETAARHLKKCFPHLYIGGPAVTDCENEWSKKFLAYCAEKKIPLDFFSWHRYDREPRSIIEKERTARKLLDSVGLSETQSILNEWNYVKGWFTDDWLYSLRTEKGLKGSSFIAGTIALSQYEPLDLLMYYDARPCAMNGMFCTDFVCDKLKGYYPFWMFNRLYQLGTACDCSVDASEIMACAAKNEKSRAVMLTRYADADSAPTEQLKLSLNDIGASADAPLKATVYLLDETHDATVVREEMLTGRDAVLYLNVDLFSTYLITFDSVCE